MVSKQNLVLDPMLRHCGRYGMCVEDETSLAYQGADGNHLHENETLVGHLHASRSRLSLSMVFYLEKILHRMKDVVGNHTLLRNVDAWVSSGSDDWDDDVGQPGCSLNLGMMTRLGWVLERNSVREDLDDMRVWERRGSLAKLVV
jgi:hypothetical protein